MRLDPDLVADLRRMNPWWEGRPMPPLPTTRRHVVASIHRRLDARLAPIVVIRGPRQIGKTIAQRQVITDLLGRGVPAHAIMRVQCDELPALDKLGEPVLRLTDWFEQAVLGRTLNEAAHAGAPAYLFFDEVQNLRAWDAQLKALVDSSAAYVVVTGSSALRIEMGRDSLSGRITTIEAGVLSLTEIAGFHGDDVGPPHLPDNGLQPLTDPQFWHSLRTRGQQATDARDRAFEWFSARGGYPLAHQRADVDWPIIADQLNENVIRRVIQHDLRVGERGRKRDAALLEELFRMACRYVGQSPGVTLLARETQRALGGNVGARRIQSYVRFLDNTLLIRAIKPLELRLKRRRGHDKLCLADHALRASWLQEQVPLTPAALAADPAATDLAGHIAESVVGTLLASVYGLDVAHLPAGHDQPEVDFVITIGTRRIPVEVKYRARLDPQRDTEGLRTFIEKAVNHAAFGLMITQRDDQTVADPRIVCLPLSSLMLLR